MRAVLTYQTPVSLDIRKIERRFSFTNEVTLFPKYNAPILQKVDKKSNAFLDGEYVPYPYLAAVRNPLDCTVQRVTW